MIFITPCPFVVYLDHVLSLSAWTVRTRRTPCPFVVYLDRQNPPEPRMVGVHDTSGNFLRLITVSYKSHVVFTHHLSCNALARVGEGEAFTHHLSCMCVCMSFAVPFWFGLSLPMRGGEARALIRLFYPFTRY